MLLVGRLLLGGAAILAASAFATQRAHAVPNLVQNGSFETNSGASQITTTNVADWSTTGYNFILNDATGDTGTGTYGALSLWGPATSSQNGLTSSPDGGSYVAADGAFLVEPIAQTLDNLIVGDTYAVSFFWAGAQQSGYDGITTEQWDVSLGSQMQQTSVVTNASHGFTGWIQETMNFTATNTSDVLSFLAVGTPNGEPPFSLLDGVSATDISTANVPEPATWAVLAVGLVGIAGLASRRRGDVPRGTP